MKEVLGDVARWQDAGRRAAIARVVGVVGSSPREAGAAMAVSEASEVAGSVSGGCVEGAVVDGGARDPRRRAGAGCDHVRLLRRGRVLRGPHLRRHDSPVRRAGRGAGRRRACSTARSASAVDASEPVALVTVIAGDGRGVEAARASRRRARSARSAIPTSIGWSAATRSASSRPASAPPVTTASTAKRARKPSRCSSSRSWSRRA